MGVVVGVRCLEPAQVADTGELLRPMKPENFGSIRFDPLVFPACRHCFELGQDLRARR